MEFYLDSAKFEEIEAAFGLGYIYGLTTTPTFMHRDGVTDVDQMILKLAEMVPILQVEALGETAEEIEAEAHRLLSIGLDPQKTVFKIPISLIGAKACKRLIDQGLQVNMHLIYTIQQAYIALSAGATYVCPLVGRLQDQGHDAISLVEQCVTAVERYRYPSKIMFSSVRHPEHVRNALNIGVHACTIPWKVLQQLPKNNFTELGTRQFFEHTRLMTLSVKDVMAPFTETVSPNQQILDALVKMTLSKYGVVIISDSENHPIGIFTDGDLRRNIQQHGEGFLQKSISDLPIKPPISIGAESSLLEASTLLKEKAVDTLAVTENGKLVGLLDVQHLLNQ
ncbi:MAG: transaldolase family protein [Bacteroidota bacterium]